VPWYPKIKLGGFIGPNGLAYYLNEYSTQDWSSTLGYPFIGVSGEEANFVTGRTIKLSNPRIYNSRSHVTLYDESGNDLSEYVDSIDAFYGKVFLNADVPGHQHVFVNYSYEKYFMEFKALDLNPGTSSIIKPGKVYSIYLKPLTDGNGSINANVLYVSTSDTLPSSKKGSTDLLLAALLVKDDTTITDYTWLPPSVIGGGIRTNMSVVEFNNKVLAPQSLTTSGNYDGRRYPANMVNIVRIPKEAAGEDSVLVEDYDPLSGANIRLKMYNAMGVPTGTQIKVYSSPTVFETATVIGADDYKTAVLSAALTSNYYIGAKIVVGDKVTALFDSSKIDSIVNLYAPVGSYQIVELT